MISFLVGCELGLLYPRFEKVGVYWFTSVLPFVPFYPMFSSNYIDLAVQPTEVFA